MKGIISRRSGDQKFAVRTKSYDGNNRLVKEVLGNGLAVTYEYDRLGRVLVMKLPDATGIGYHYNNCFLESVERHDKQGNSLYKHVYEEYDLTGKLCRCKLAGKKSTLKYAYDLLGRMKTATSEKWSESIERYDAVGNILAAKIVDGKETSSTYAYDDLYQLTNETGNSAHTYSYDSHHNRTSKDGKRHELNALHQLIDDGEWHYSYDENGNLQEKTSGTAFVKYTYDALDRLICMEKNEQKVRYTYDDTNRRLSKIFSNLLFRTLPIDYKTIRYLYQGQNEIGACDSDGNITELRLLGLGMGAEIGAAVAIEVNKKAYVPLHDHNGNVVCLLGSRVDGIVESYRYSAFGEEEFSSAISPWRYASKRIDEESGLVYFGRRYYDPTTGRWATPDPLGREGGPNLYAYVLNSPLAHIDLYGLFGQPGGIMDGLSCFFNRFGNMVHTLCSRIGSFWRSECPIPIIRDGISAICHLMKEGTFRGYKMEYSEQHSSFGKVYGLDLMPNVAVGYANGICNTRESCEEGAEAISKVHGNAEVFFLHNATHGTLNDVGETVCQKCGIPTNSVKKCVQMVKAMLNKVGATGKAILYGFSQGGQIIKAALGYLSAAERRQVEIITLGSAAMISHDQVNAKNYISRSDPVPFIADPIGVMGGLLSRNTHIEFLPSNDLPFTGHAFLKDSYQKVVKDRGEQYINKYLTSH